MAAIRPMSQSVSSYKDKQKPVEWISSLIQRYQDQLPTRTGKTIDRESRDLLNTTHSCIINVSKHHLHLVLQALVRVLKAVNASGCSAQKWTSTIALSQSRLVILETLLECMSEAHPISGRNMEREGCLKGVLDEMWAILGSANGAANVLAANALLLEKAKLVVSRVGELHPSLIISRCETALKTIKTDEPSEDAIALAVSYITTTGYVTFELDVLVKVLQLVSNYWPPPKDHLESICNMISCIVWRWIERYPDQFSNLQHSPNEHISEVCDTLFAQMNSADKRRPMCWPVQMLLIALSPCSLEAIAHAEQQGVNLPEILIVKRLFVEQLSATVQSGGGNGRVPLNAQMQFACHAAVNLCKCATYVNLSDFFVFNVVQQLIEHVKVALLTGSRPRDMDRSVLVDCFVALFRLKFDNDVFRTCLSPSQPTLQLVLIEALSRIASQHRLQWWPRIDLLMSRSDQLRSMFLLILEKVLETDPASHLSIGVTRSWQKVSGKWRAERPSAGSVGSNTPANDCTQHQILVGMLQLIATHPTLLIRKKMSSDDNCVESVVSALVLLVDHPSLATHSMRALLALHSVVPEWNVESDTASLNTFFSVSSHMLFSVCQKLVHLQSDNAENVISWLKVLIKRRIEYLTTMSESITPEMVDGITYQSLVKFEVVCFMYLWNCSADLVLCCFSLFSLHSEQCGVVRVSSIDSSLAKILSAVPHSTIMTTGRIALQKSVNRVLRSLPHSNSASHEAWHETFRIWELFTNQLVHGCKDHADFVEHVTKVTTYALDGIVDAWGSMTGFLCSFSHLICVKEPNHVSTFMNRLLSVLRMEETVNRDVMCKCVKEVLSYEMEHSMDPFLLSGIASQLSAHSSNNQFVEHVIYILKNVLSRRQVAVLRVDSTTQMVSALLHSQSSAERTPAHSLVFTRKLCSLLHLVLSNSSARRLPSSLQSRMLDSLSSALSLVPSLPSTSTRCDVLLAVLAALSKLFATMSIVIQPITFNKVFSQLLECFLDPSVPSSPMAPMGDDGVAGALGADAIRRCNDSVLNTLAALVNTCPDQGVVRVLETSWGGEYKARGWMLEAICCVLCEQTPSSSVSDRQGGQTELIRLLALPGEDHTLPLVAALANSLPNDLMDRLCRVVLSTFSERVNDLLWAVLWMEAETALSPSTLFRGSSFAAKLISYCLRVFGHSYLLRTLRPCITSIMSILDSDNGRGVEGAPDLPPQESIITACEQAFTAIFDSAANCPLKLRVLCRQLCLVINTRFPSQGLSALGKILFLRFFNPAIVSPFEMGLCPSRPSRSMSRSLTFISKLLQCAVNQPTTCRDSSIQPFLAMLRQKETPLNQYLSFLIEEVPEEKLRTLAVTPSTNIHLLLNVHTLFIHDRMEILRHLRFTSSSSTLYSRVDALLKSLPDDVPLPPSPPESLDPSLPFFYQVSYSNPPVFAIILRRLQNVEVENAAKQIADKCTREKWICLVDGLMCDDPPNMMKLLSPDSFAYIDQVLILHCSSQLFSKLNESFHVFEQLRISFDPLALRVPLDTLPHLSKLLMMEPTYSMKATLISSEDIPVTVKLLDNMMMVSGSRRWGTSTALVSDFYLCTDFDQMELIDENTLSLVQADSVLSLTCDAKELIARISMERTRIPINDKGAFNGPLKIHSRKLISLALVHLADPDVSVRSTSYRLLKNLSSSLDLPTLSCLQDTPCVFVPSNCLRLLDRVCHSLVSSDPDLLISLVPRVIDSANITLVYALNECWPLLTQLRDDQRGELFGFLVSGTSMGGALGAAMCEAVWPRIGRLDDMTLSMLLDRLFTTTPLSCALSIVQATSSGGDRLAAILVERCMTHLTNGQTDFSMSRALSFLLVLTFNASTVFLDTQLSNLLHMVSCVAGTGSVFQRSVVCSLVSNIFHSFGSNPDFHLSDSMRGSLGLFLRQLSNEEALRLFRVSELENGRNVVDTTMQYIDTDCRSEGDCDYDMLEEDTPSCQTMGHRDLHQLLSLVISVLADLQADIAGGRDWLMEWRVLSRHWAFEGNGDVQIRSLIAFSCLADSISDLEMKGIIQLLVQVVVQRRDSLVAMAGVSLSLIRLHTLTAPSCPIHRLAFWVSILLFQLEHATIYEHAIQLMYTNLTHLDHMGLFENTTLERLVLDARLPLEWDLKALDQCAGLPFRTNFNFALVGYLLKGLRQPSMSVKVVQLLQLLLRISAKSNRHSPYALTKDNVAFLLALLPFDEKVQTRFRVTSSDNVTARSLITAPWTTFEYDEPFLTSSKESEQAVSSWDEEEEEGGPLLDPQIIVGEQTQALAVTVLAILARSCPNVDIILDYLLEAATVFPAVVPVIECLLDQRIVGLVQSCQSPRMLSTVVRLIESSASGESGGPQQAVYFLQQCGFAGMWRYAGAFLSQRASVQAINTNLCSCLECIGASL